MVAVKVNAFGGMIPATDDRLLPDQAAALSQNAWLYNGQLTGMISPQFIRDMNNSGYGKVFRIPNNYYDSEHFDDAVFLEFSGIDTDVLRSPVVGDTFDRYYWAAPNTAPQVNSLARLQAGLSSYLLGVPQPTGAPTLSLAGGVSSTTESRAYVVTWVTAFGEEGPPSDPALVTGVIDATWTVTLPVAGGLEIAQNNLDKARIYRTVTAVGGTATFFFVAEVPVLTATYADTITDEVVSSNDELQSTTWTAPPADLQGFVAMPNGMIAGWRGNELWFCEPFRPHAWPAAYTNSVEYPIIGLGVTNQTLVVCTAGYPMVATGINPASITLSKLASFEPCMSRGSVISVPEGVYYASPNGLVLVANGVAALVTEGLIAKDEWNRFLKVATLRATRIGNAYYTYGSTRSGFFQPNFVQDGIAQVDDFAGGYNGVLIDPTNQRVAFNRLTSATPVTNIFNDARSGDTIMIRDDKMLRINIADDTSARDTALWRSKVFQPNDKKNFSVLRVYFEVPPWAPAQSLVRNTNPVQTLQPDQWGIVRVYADDTLVMTRELRTSGELMKLPSGFKADFWQVEFETILQIDSFQLATSSKELAKV